MRSGTTMIGDWVERVVARGDEGAFRALYERHTPFLLRFVLRLIADSERSEAEDVLQETWIRAVERFHDVEWRSSVRTWLHGIAFNVVREQWHVAPGFSTDAQALVIGFHELMWDLLDVLEERNLVQRPSVLDGEGNGPADVATLIFAVR